MNLRNCLLLFLIFSFSALLCACTQNNTFIGPPTTKTDVNRQLAPGEWGLTLLSADQYPDMRNAFMNKDGLIQAIDRSIAYLQSPSSQKFFPDGPITHDQVLSSLYDFKYMLQNISSPDEFQQQIVSRYDVYISKGYDENNSVWFTGYYTPILYGSMTETPEYQYPVYKRPPDLVSDPVSGQTLGQKVNGVLQPYPTRSELLSSGALKGLELVWFSTPLDAYIVEIQGSAKVILTDGETVTIGYAGDNGRNYNGLGAELVKEGKIPAEKLSLPSIQEYFQEHPQDVETIINNNDFMAFLKPYDPNRWPLASLGVMVTDHRTLATDKTITAPPYQTIFPRAALTFVQAQMPDTQGNITPFTGFMLDQDSGGAIRAAGRADIYMGIGPDAQAQAGYEYSQGRLYYLFLKPGVAPQGGPTTEPAMPDNSSENAPVQMPSAENSQGQ
ncbi:MAG TPA: MltA domain-containing protein [Phycisphaerae bacterium]|nr:MltA domain-containing protein [Phycisphaerae bacterium]